MKILFSVALLLNATYMFAQAPISIADARKQEFGTVVTKVAGRITVGKEFRNTSYIQDGTAGIAVFNSAFRSGVQLGDSVVIENATLIEFQATAGAPGSGLSELSGTDLRFTVVPVERVEPRPKTTTIPLVGEGVEGQLIRIRRVKFLEKGAFQGETNYSVLDAQGNDIPVRIDGGTNIAANSLPIPEEEIDLVGVVSQFRGGYQVLPRFAEDVGLPPVAVDTVKKSRTLDVTTWNLEWYGSTDTTQGPRDKNRQRRSIRQVMDTVRADIYALQEVLTQEALDALSDSIAGDYGNLFASDVPSDQKMAYIYNKETITPITSGLAVNGGSQAWAGGRFPYRLTFDANIDGRTRRLVIFNIHGKATSDSTAAEDYQRRKTDAETFHAYLRDFYADSMVIVTGDYNDILTGTIVDSTFETPYISFVSDAARWASPTLPLEERGLTSYIGFNRSFLDHYMVSTDLFPMHHRTYLENPQGYMSSYSATVSDHLPVTSRYLLDGSTSVIEPVSLDKVGARISPNPMVDHGTVELIVNEPASVTVKLVDQLGRTMTLLNEQLSAQVRLVQIPVETLPSGAYQLVIERNGIVAAETVAITR